VVDELEFPCHPAGGRRLPARYEGYRLWVANTRIPVLEIPPPVPDPLFLPVPRQPEDVRPLASKPGPANAVVPAGRIGRGTPPPTDCGEPPFIAGATQSSAVTRHVLRRTARGMLFIRWAWCPTRRCDLRFVIRQGAHRIRSRRLLPRGESRVTVPRAQARPLRPGVVRFAVRIDGRLTSAGQVCLDRGARAVPWHGCSPGTAPTSAQMRRASR
jgi:hypothetical protein